MSVSSDCLPEVYHWDRKETIALEFWVIELNSLQILFGLISFVAPADAGGAHNGQQLLKLIMYFCNSTTPDGYSEQVNGKGTGERWQWAYMIATL